MTLAERFQPDSRQDVFEIVQYFDQFSETVGDQFRDAVGRTVAMLCEHPELGEIFCIDTVGNIRHRTIADFQNYVIFYRSDETELLVVRVLQGNQDLTNFFEK